MPQPTTLEDFFVDNIVYLSQTAEKSSRAAQYGAILMLITAIVEQQLRHALGETDPVNLLHAVIGGLVIGALVQAFGNIHHVPESLSDSFKLSLFYLMATYLSLEAGHVFDDFINNQNSTTSRSDHMLQAGALLVYPCYQLHRSLPAIGAGLNNLAERFLAYIDPNLISRRVTNA